VKNWATFVPSLLTRVKQGFDNNEDLTTIVTDWLYGPNGQVDVDSIEFKLFKQELMPDVEKKSV
jgi:hypothetical protein